MKIYQIQICTMVLVPWRPNLIDFFIFGRVNAWMTNDRLSNEECDLRTHEKTEIKIATLRICN